MKRILLTTAAFLALSAPVMAADQTTDQSAQAQASSDLYLRSGDSKPAADGAAYLRGAPINLNTGTSGSTEAQKAAMSQVYDPEAKQPVSAYAAAANPAADYSATTYNKDQSGSAEAESTYHASSGRIASPFPTWFGGYKPVPIEVQRQNAMANAQRYAHDGETARQQALQQSKTQQQQQPKRTTAFGTTSELKQQQQQQQQQ